MNIQIDVPEELAAELRSVFGNDLGRPALEALVLEGYRTRKIGIGQVTRLLNFESRFHAEEWLARHEVSSNYGPDDLDLDRATLATILRDQSL